ncbi:MAG TPA: hypothetical protein DCQ04_03300 [Actinobacteria bacterium]|nr:hypothetical protein [Actinomycetota bacterium]
MMPNEQPRQSVPEMDIGLGAVEAADAVPPNVEERRATIAATAGSLAGAFSPGYLNLTRDDWPG